VSYVEAILRKGYKIAELTQREFAKFSRQEADAAHRLGLEGLRSPAVAFPRACFVPQVRIEEVHCLWQVRPILADDSMLKAYESRMFAKVHSERQQARLQREAWWIRYWRIDWRGHAILIVHQNAVAKELHHAVE
jgi:hypothetical protein